MTASPEKSLSETSRLRVSVQPASPSNVNSYEKFKWFLHITCSRLFVILFVIEYLVSGLCLRSVFIAYPNPREHCVFRSLKVGNKFLILSYLQSK